MACDGLVHRVVEHFGSEVVECALVGAADVHAGPPPDGLEPFENFNRAGIVVAAAGGQLLEQVFGLGEAIGSGFAGIQALPGWLSGNDQNRVGAGSTTVTVPLPIWRTSIARSPIPVL